MKGLEMFKKRSWVLERRKMEGYEEWILDFFHRKQPYEEMDQILKFFVTEYCHILVDTKLLYSEKKDASQEKKQLQQELINYLEAKKISYVCKEKKEQENLTILGIPMNARKEKMITEYLLAFSYTKENYDFLYLLPRTSFFCFPKTEADGENDLSQTIEQYDRAVVTDIYVDTFFKRIRLTVKNEDSENLLASLQSLSRK